MTRRLAVTHTTRAQPAILLTAMGSEGADLGDVFTSDVEEHGFQCLTPSRADNANETTRGEGRHATSSSSPALSPIFVPTGSSTFDTPPRADNTAKEVESSILPPIELGEDEDRTPTPPPTGVAKPFVLAELGG